MAAAIPGTTFELLPAAGHMPQLENPDLLDEVVAPCQCVANAAA